jgi:hypothetical protein
MHGMHYTVKVEQTNTVGHLTQFQENSMARTRDGVLERLEETVSVECLAEARGVVLQEHGAGGKGDASILRNEQEFRRISTRDRFGFVAYAGAQG